MSPVESGINNAVVTTATTLTLTARDETLCPFSRDLLKFGYYVDRGLPIEYTIHRNRARSDECQGGRSAHDLFWAQALFTRWIMILSYYFSKCFRVEDRLMNYLLARELFTKNIS